MDDDFKSAIMAEFFDDFDDLAHIITIHSTHTSNLFIHAIRLRLLKWKYYTVAQMNENMFYPPLHHTLQDVHIP